MVKNTATYKTYFIVCLVLLVCFVVGTESLLAQKTRVHINDFFKQPELIIVYGTHNPATTDFLIQQAQKISSGYKENRGISISIKSDKEVKSKDIKEKTLIIIGTPRSNSFLEGMLSKLPLEFQDGGYIFGNKIYREKDKVLRFLYPNPFNPKNILAIYTGNDDNELRSRYFDFNLFGMGGEYSITQKTFVIRSGFFKKEKNKWAYDSAFDWDNEENIKKFFHTIHLNETKHYKLYYFPDSPLAPHIKHVGELKEKEYPKHFELLKQPVKDYKITIYYFESVAQMVEVGMFGNDPSTLLITFIGASYNDIPGWGTHEDMHPLSYYILGQISGGGDISSPLLGEGIACLVHGDGTWHGKPIDYWTVKFLTEGKLPTLNNFLVGYRIINWLITYPTSGHFVKFIIANYGVEKFAALWDAEDVKREIPEILGVSLEQLEQQWHKHIISLESQYKDELEAGKHFELGLTCYWDEDFPAAEIKFKNALNLDAHNTEIHYFLARTYFEQGHYEAAKKYFESYLKLKRPPMYEWMTPHAYLNLGRIADFAEDREAAVHYYNKALEFPDERKSHEYAKKGIDKPLQKEDIAKVYDLPHPWPFGIHIPAFRPELMGGSVSSFSYCLSYIKAGEYEKALKYFDRALLEDKEDPDILYFLGVTQFNLGKYKEALKTFDQIIKSKRKPYREYIPTLIHLYKGKIYTKLNDPKSAQSEYKVVLSMPDWRNAHAEASKYLKK
jgi:tetratricopeptide (TPR) repeat protein